MALGSKGRMWLDCCKSGDTEGLSSGTVCRGAPKYFFSARILRRVPNVYRSRRDDPASLQAEGEHDETHLDQVYGQS
jgi:hypothetical protein